MTDKMQLVQTFEDGLSLYIQDNEAGGVTYYSDEIGSGVMVWDTVLVSEKMLLRAIQHYRKSDSNIAEAVDKLAKAILEANQRWIKSEVCT